MTDRIGINQSANDLCDFSSLEVIGERDGKGNGLRHIRFLISLVECRRTMLRS